MIRIETLEGRTIYINCSTITMIEQHQLEQEMFTTIVIVTGDRFRTREFAELLVNRIHEL